MDAPNKLPLVQEGMQMLLSQLNDGDRVAIIVYAGSAGIVLESTPAGKTKKIRRALSQLAAGGSTNGGAGIALAYQTARDQFIEGGMNRVILCTDGDFNVGTTGTDELVKMVEKEAKGGVFLTVLGFGMGNHNDAMLEQISGRGNGNYAYIDTAKEARKVLVDQTQSTLVTIAKDVKIQVFFNPLKVAAYRLIGYENRMLAKEEFNDDTKDAGEIGAGHVVTALYELVPVGIDLPKIAPAVDSSPYVERTKPTSAADRDELLTVKLRYKLPDENQSRLVEFPVANSNRAFQDADDDVRFAAAVAGFGMQLRRSPNAGKWTLADVERVAVSAKGRDRSELRAEFVELVQTAARLAGEKTITLQE
jgi:Ca-activated chloride channel family protein